MPSEVLGAAPYVIIAALVSWCGAIITYKDKKKKEADDTHDRLEMHRDELTLRIIQTGRTEIEAARIEVGGLRDEVKKLRAMETHFYHFQQSLDHLEALLVAKTDEEREVAERNARAFLNRMRRLADATGTISNEVQRASSEVTLLDRENQLGKGMPDGGTDA